MVALSIYALKNAQWVAAGRSSAYVNQQVHRKIQNDLRKWKQLYKQP